MQRNWKETTLTRKTISIDDEIEAILRKIQGDCISSDTQSTSLSKVINIVVLCGLIASETLDSAQLKILREFAEGKKTKLTNENLEIYKSILVKSKRSNL